MSSIRTINLSKSFGSIRAVHRINLEVMAGEIFGLVGPDGSGKTTTLRMLCGILQPDEGEAFVAGYNLRSEAERVKEQVGYLPQRFGLYGDLSVIENILFYADLYRVPKKERKERIARLLRFASLERFVGRRVQDLSGGMKQKLGLICALIHTPSLLLLDEPTTGVDPVSRRDFWSILYDLVKEGVTILFSTSYLDEAERCGRIGLMNRGELLISETPAAVKARVQGVVLEIRTDNNQKAVQVLEETGSFGNLVLSGDRLHLVADPSQESERAIRNQLLSHGIDILQLEAVKPTLEDAFVAAVQERRMPSPPGAGRASL